MGNKASSGPGLGDTVAVILDTTTAKTLLAALALALSGGGGKKGKGKGKGKGAAKGAPKS